MTARYDDAGRLHTVTDWLSHTTTFNYNADNFLDVAVVPNTTTATFTPDGADRLMGITDTKDEHPRVRSPTAVTTQTRSPLSPRPAYPTDNHSYSYTQLNQLKTQDAKQLQLRQR